MTARLDVAVDGVTWSLLPGGFCYRAGSFVPWVSVPCAVRRAYASAEAARRMDEAHEEARAEDARRGLRRDSAARRVERARASEAERSFVLAAYVSGSYPLRFTLRGEDVDAGVFALECMSALGWAGRPQTVYRRLFDVLLDAGVRYKAHYSACFRGRNAGGMAHVPKSMEAVL